MQEKVRPSVRSDAPLLKKESEGHGKKNNRKSRARGMFVDPEEMKQKIRDQMLEPKYDVCEFYWTYGPFQAIARHPMFEMITLGVISFNALWISIDTDHNKADVLLQADPGFQFVEQFFCVYFTFELTCRFCAFENKLNCMRDAWFVFDSVLVTLMVLETWILAFAMFAADLDANAGPMANAGILKMFKLLRLSRMSRMARLLRSMPELLILIKGMVSAMRSVFFTLLLLIGLLYIFGIAFTQLLVGTEPGELYFGSVSMSMETLLIDGTMMDNFGEVSRDLVGESFIYCLIFWLFALLAAATVLNMLIGVLCEVVSAVAETEREEITVSIVKEALEEVIIKSGKANTPEEVKKHKVNKEEFLDIVTHPDAAKLLGDVDVDVFGLIDIVDFLYEEDAEKDGDQEEATLSFGEFVEQLISLRGSNKTTVTDMTNMRKYIRVRTAKLEEQLKHGFAMIEHEIDTIRFEIYGGDPPMAAPVVGRGSRDFDKTLSASAPPKPQAAPTVGRGSRDFDKTMSSSAPAKPQAVTGAVGLLSPPPAGFGVVSPSASIGAGLPKAPLPNPAAVIGKAVEEGGSSDSELTLESNGVGAPEVGGAAPKRKIVTKKKVVKKVVAAGTAAGAAPPGGMVPVASGMPVESGDASPGDELLAVAEEEDNETEVTEATEAAEATPLADEGAG